VYAKRLLQTAFHDAHWHVTTVGESAKHTTISSSLTWLSSQEGGGFADGGGVCEDVRAAGVRSCGRCDLRSERTTVLEKWLAMWPMMRSWTTRTTRTTWLVWVQNMVKAASTVRGKIACCNKVGGRHACTSTSCSHARINPLKQRKSVDVSYSAVLPTELGWGIPLRSHHIAPCAWPMRYWIRTVTFLGED